MKIGVISDTHLQASDPLPPLIAQAFQNVDLILHAGDFDSLTVLDELERLAPILAVRGYGDQNSPERDLPETLVHNVLGWRVGLVHDIAHPAYGIRAVGTEARLQFPREPLRALLKRRFKQEMEAVVFGDLHTPAIFQRHAILLMNPGSPTRPHLPGLPYVGTVGFLDVDTDALLARIVSLEAGLPVMMEGEIRRG
jgi:putative phosphoesterase